MGSRRIVTNPLSGPLSDGDVPDATTVRAFHRSLPGYAMTPLREAPGVAAELGVGHVLVKDESARLGMPSFKILGASWATYRALCARLGLPYTPITGLGELAAQLTNLSSDGAPLELVAATDGNHGRAVARMARLLGVTAHILVPADMVAARIAAIESEGAAVTVVSRGYDDAIAASARLADERHLVISDTSWPGYTEVPGWVIDGYATIGAEIDEQLTGAGLPAPTVAAAQLGVGAFGAAMVRHFHGRARLVAVEPVSADCVTASVEAGEPITIPGPQTSVMAGLNCGTPSLIAWPVVSAGFEAFTAVEDADTEHAMRLLAADGIVSGESGAAGLAGLLAFGGHLGLTERDTVLLVSTEGATDPDGYRRVVPDAVLAAGPTS